MIKRQVIRNSSQLWTLFDKVKDRDWTKPVLISVSIYRPPRSTDQNALLHVLFRDVANHVGRPEQEIKDIFKHQFGPMKTVRVGDVETILPKGTSEYNKLEMIDFIDNVQAKGNEWGVEWSEIE